jgi:Mrp family chromosome partitioning ATPase/capsular polysaccharide biosynthesis protein
MLMILILVVVAVAVALVVSETSPTRYRASADLLVNPLSSNDDTFLGIDVLRESNDQSRSVLTVSRLIDSQKTAQIAKGILHTTLSPNALLSKIAVAPVGQADIVSITATAQRSAAASAIANAFAAAMIIERKAAFQAGVQVQVQRIRQYLKTLPTALQNSTQAVTLQQRLAQLVPLIGAPDPTISIGNTATPPSSPSWPRPKLAAAVAFIAMLLLASAFAIVVEFWNPRVRDEEQILFEHRLPILARVPRLKRRVAAAYLAGQEPLPRASWEAYRRLRVSLDRASEETPGRATAIVVTSSAPAEAKTMTSLSLALSFAVADRRVALVDADLRHPMIASIFGIAPPARAIEEALSDSPDGRFLVQAPENPNLLLLLTRPEGAGLIDTITPERIATMIKNLSRAVDVIVFDTAPVGEAAETIAFAEAADEVVLSVRLGATMVDRLSDTLRLFAQRRVPLSGVVLTLDRGAEPSPYDYGYAGPAQPKLRGERRRPDRPVQLAVSDGRAASRDDQPERARRRT